MLWAERVFSGGGMVVMPGWLLLFFAPGWRWTQRYATFIVPFVLAVVYATMLWLAPKVPGAGFGSVSAVSLLFSQPAALTAGWIHYLVFDLFTGAWEARDAVRLGISRWIVLPCLLLTFLFGPVGLATYLMVRLAMRRQVGASFQAERA